MTPSASVPILLAGIPRSGTTWAATVLAAGAGRPLVLEPDNEKSRPEALAAKRGLHRFPRLAPGVEAPAYGRLWDSALARRPLSPRQRAVASAIGRQAAAAVERDITARCGPRGGHGHLGPFALGRAKVALRLASATPRRGAGDVAPLVKTVHGILALPWIAARWPVQVVLVRRDPLAVAASLLRLQMPDGDRNLPPPPASDARSPVERVADQVAYLDGSLAALAAGHSDWTVVRHEDLAADPRRGFPRLAARMGLPWGPAGDEAISAADTEGQGFAPRRSPAQRASGPALDPSVLATLTERLRQAGGPSW